MRQLICLFVLLIGALLAHPPHLHADEDTAEARIARLEKEVKLLRLQLAELRAELLALRERGVSTPDTPEPEPQADGMLVGSWRLDVARTIAHMRAAGGKDGRVAELERAGLEMSIVIALEKNGTFRVQISAGGRQNDKAIGTWKRTGDEITLVTEDEKDEVIKGRLVSGELHLHESGDPKDVMVFVPTTATVAVSTETPEDAVDVEEIEIKPVTPRAGQVEEEAGEALRAAKAEFELRMKELQRAEAEAVEQARRAAEAAEKAAKKAAEAAENEAGPSGPSTGPEAGGEARSVRTSGGSIMGPWMLDSEPTIDSILESMGGMLEAVDESQREMTLNLMRTQLAGMAFSLTFAKDGTWSGEVTQPMQGKQVVSGTWSKKGDTYEIVTLKENGKDSTRKEVLKAEIEEAHLVVRPPTQGPINMAFYLKRKK